MGHRLFLVAVLKLVTCKALFEFCSETFHEELFPVEHATQLWRSMGKTKSCKKSPESPGCSFSLIDFFFLANQEQGIQMAVRPGSDRFFTKISRIGFN